MRPNELGIMLDQWARAYAPQCNLAVLGVESALVGIADSRALTEDGEVGSLYPIAMINIYVKSNVLPFEGEADVGEFQRLLFQICHDIWMTKDLAVRGRVIVSK